MPTLPKVGLLLSVKRILLFAVLAMAPSWGQVAMAESAQDQPSTVHDNVRRDHERRPAPENESLVQATSNGDGQVTYTIHGRKDPRLQATFLASYISTSKSEACSYRNPTTATRKVRIGSKTYPITEEHYRIEIPVYLDESENECGYRFARIEVLLRRQHDQELYSRHILLANSPKVMAIYFGRKGGFGGQASLTMPSEITTDKRHFRVARKTQYVCRTKYREWKHSSGFYCFMRIRDGEGENRFIPTNEWKTRATHPEFGIDELESDTLQVDFLADDQGSKRYTGKETLPDHFRTLSPPPDKPQSVECLKRWFRELF